MFLNDGTELTKSSGDTRANVTHTLFLFVASFFWLEERLLYTQEGNRIFFLSSCPKYLPDKMLCLFYQASRAIANHKTIRRCVCCKTTAASATTTQKLHEQTRVSSETNLWVAVKETESAAKTKKKQKE